MAEPTYPISISTHVLDSAAGGGRTGVGVQVVDSSGLEVASALTDESGRILALASGLLPGRYTVRWQLGGSFLIEGSATVELTEARHYHVPLLASDHSATVYLGA